MHSTYKHSTKLEISVDGPFLLIVFHYNCLQFLPCDVAQQTVNLLRHPLSTQRLCAVKPYE